jgi:hypothetical protein
MLVVSYEYSEFSREEILKLPATSLLRLNGLLDLISFFAPRADD